MKKAPVYIAIILFLCTAGLYSAEPTIKFIYNDGSTKQFNISEIEKIDLIKSKLSFKILLFYHNGIPSYYDLRGIDSIKLSGNSMTWYCGSWVYERLNIDSAWFKPNWCYDIEIGNQTWMCSDLDADHYRNGDSIPEVRDSATMANLKTGAWCYYNNKKWNGAYFGKLYNWYAVNDPRGLAPQGYHIPSDSEWTVLENFLGGSAVAGGKLKSTGTIESNNGLWYSPNTGATNESGFSALPGGWTDYMTGEFKHLGINGNWWTSTQSASLSAWSRFLSKSYSDIVRTYSHKSGFFSVRCIED